MSTSRDRPSVDQPAEAVGQSKIPAPRPTSEAAGGYAAYPSYGRDTAAGYASVAGFLLLLGGLWDFFLGLALLARSAYFSSLPGYGTTSHYAYHWTLTSWGWANLIFGIVVVAGGIGVLLGYDWARWAAIALAVIGGLGTFMFVPIFPVWSILVIAIDVFIIWALATARKHQEMARPRHRVPQHELGKAGAPGCCLASFMSA